MKTRPPQLSQALSICESFLGPAIYRLPDDFMSYDRFLSVLPRLNKTSTPGIPYCRQKPTIGEWLGFDGLNYDPVQVDRLWYDVQLVFQDRWDHLMKVFIKQEPHKRIKIHDRRWRLIICFSLPVQIAWKMCFDYFNDIVIDKAYDLPIQHGFLLFHGGWKQFYRQWRSQGYNSGTDASAWDWSVAGWLMDAVLDLRHRLTRANPTTMRVWKRLTRTLYSRAFDGAKIVLPSGLVLQQTFHGLQKSGSPNTICDNSLARFLCSVIVALKMNATLTVGRFVGDDALERHPDDVEYRQRLISAYADIGIVVKSIEEGLEFVGHRFYGSGPSPLYLRKHLWNLTYTDEEIIPQYLDQMARLYCHTKAFQIWELLALRFGVTLYSQQYYRDWYDYESVGKYDASAIYGHILGL